MNPKHTLKEYADALMRAGLLTATTLTPAAENAVIDCLSYDTRSLHGTSLFLCKGAHFKAEYLSAALAQGAAAYVAEKPYPVDAPQQLVSDIRYAMVVLGQLFYDHVTDKLTSVGITGTKGKSTTAYYVRSILNDWLTSEGKPPCAILSSIDNYDGVITEESHITTPEVLELYQHFQNAYDSGISHLVMEVSSHALVQRRVGAIDFALGVFTNLTQDHLDYHGTMEAYCDAKARLFRQCRAAVVNGDDPWTLRLLENVTCPVTRFGQGLANDLVGWDAHYCTDRVSFTACSDSEHIPVTLHIPGAFSLYNALAALAAAQALGIPIEDAAQALSLCQGVRGRAEVVPTDTDYTVLIDYAHTPDGLKNILSTVCGFADARVLIVFGCGGDRDRTKRAEMGRIAARLADEVIVTSDNPRTENPYAILHEILAGMADSATPFAVLESRREAITYALDHARTGDVVVLAGKGHETYQVVGAETLPLDERQVVREHLSQ